MSNAVFENRPDVKVKNDFLPETPGVYLMKDARGRLLYVGKAGSLKRRVSSYFSRPHDARIEKLVSEIVKIDYIETDTALEALILEASLIKKHRPPYNIKDKDDKSFLYIEITKDDFPRVVLVRGKSVLAGKRFGPFTSASSVRIALKIIRKIFPFSVHPPEMLGKYKRPCFDYEIGLCPGTCVDKADKKGYLLNIRNIEKLLEGRKKTVIRSLMRRMAAASAALDFEGAQRFKRQIFSLQHIEDTALIGREDSSLASEWSGPHRIEGYDISNISGTAAVGSMVVFTDGKADKNEYRMFRIRTIEGANDTGMMQEVMRRRLQNDWPLPELILVDGGLGQVNAVREILTEFKVTVPVVGMITGQDRKDTRLVGSVTGIIDKRVLVRVRDEAHRFAINYHRRVRGANLIKR